jgi:hypothetical protein
LVLRRPDRTFEGQAATGRGAVASHAPCGIVPYRCPCAFTLGSRSDSQTHSATSRAPSRRISVTLALGWNNGVPAPSSTGPWVSTQPNPPSTQPSSSSAPYAAIRMSGCAPERGMNGGPPQSIAPHQCRPTATQRPLLWSISMRLSHHAGDVFGRDAGLAIQRRVEDSGRAARVIPASGECAPTSAGLNHAGRILPTRCTSCGYTG